MNRISAALLGAVAAVALAQAASAADLPVKAPPAPIVAAPYNWSGFYLGGQFGYLWGRTRVEENGVLTEPDAKTNGAIGGLLAGYNWQTGPYVFGLEADASWSNAHGTGVAAVIPNTYDLNWNAHGAASSATPSTTGCSSSPAAWRSRTSPSMKAARRP